MKYIIALLSLFASINCQAQTYNHKFGKISDNELKMTVCAQDSSAAAYIINEQGDLRYDFSADYGFRTIYEYSTRIKILKDKGLDKANIILPYYLSTNANSEKITGLEAFSYNLKNGKIEKTKLTKDLIFDELVYKNKHQIKFAIPDVKVGSVIEYRYKITSPFYYSIPEWNIQHDVPVLYSYLETLIPEYFLFNSTSRGYVPVKRTEKKESQTFIVGISGQVESINCSSTKLVFLAENVPAMPHEEYVWCPNDFMSSVFFEIRGINFPYSFFKPIANTWKSMALF